MKTATFLVHILLDDTSPDTLAGIADQISDDLADLGLTITSVTPWNHPTTSPGALGAGLPSLPPISPLPPLR